MLGLYGPTKHGARVPQARSQTIAALLMRMEGEGMLMLVDDGHAGIALLQGDNSALTSALASAKSAEVSVKVKVSKLDINILRLSEPQRIFFGVQGHSELATFDLKVTVGNETFNTVLKVQGFTAQNGKITEHKAMLEAYLAKTLVKPEQPAPEAAPNNAPTC